MTGVVLYFGIFVKLEGLTVGLWYTACDDTVGVVGVQY